MIFCPKCGLIPFAATWTVTQCCGFHVTSDVGYALNDVRRNTDRTEAKILVTANDSRTNHKQKTSLSRRQFLRCAMSKALWQDTHVTFQLNLKYLTQWKSLAGKSLFLAFSEIKDGTEAETQSQLHVCCTLEQKDKPSRQSSPCATQFNGSSVSVMCLQTKCHPLLTSASLPLPPCTPGERAGSLACRCVTTKVDVAPLRLSHASWW